MARFLFIAIHLILPKLGESNEFFVFSSWNWVYWWYLIVFLKTYASEDRLRHGGGSNSEPRLKLGGRCVLNPCSEFFFFILSQYIHVRFAFNCIGWFKVYLIHMLDIDWFTRYSIDDSLILMHMIADSTKFIATSLSSLSFCSIFIIAWCMMIVR